jgi:hypothetical protein
MACVPIDDGRGVHPEGAGPASFGPTGLDGVMFEESIKLAISVHSIRNIGYKNRVSCRF